MHKPTHRRGLQARQIVSSRREAPVRHTFVNMAGALPCRPEPRAVFDHVASNPLTRPWRHVADPARACAAAAARLGGKAAQDTEDNIIAFMIAMLEYMLEPLNQSVRCVGEVTYPALAREHGEAVEALAVARMAPTPENLA